MTRLATAFGGNTCCDASSWPTVGRSRSACCAPVDGSASRPWPCTRPPIATRRTWRWPTGPCTSDRPRRPTATCGWTASSTRPGPPTPMPSTRATASCRRTPRCPGRWTRPASRSWAHGPRSSPSWVTRPRPRNAWRQRGCPSCPGSTTPTWPTTSSWPASTRWGGRCCSRRSPVVAARACARSTTPLTPPSALPS